MSMSSKKELHGETPTKKLRICCYAFSSSNTIEPYNAEAYNLGRILARRGHTCVNGAGHAGCMGALNNGASDAGGHIVGVIHRMFAVDGAGFHPVFEKGRYANSELQMAGGNDLQQRKRLLVQDAHALIVLPGGPGTWDEVRKCSSLKYIQVVFFVKNIECLFDIRPFPFESFV